MTTPSPKGVIKMYTYYCQKCGYCQSFDTKEQYKAAKKFHKTTGCVLVDTKYKVPIYAREGVVEHVVKELEEKEEKKNG